MEVELGIDDAPRTVEVPTELADAVAADPAATAAFDARSSSNQRGGHEGPPRRLGARRAARLIPGGPWQGHDPDGDGVDLYALLPSAG